MSMEAPTDDPRREEAAPALTSDTSGPSILPALTTGVWMLVGLALIFALQLAGPLLVPLIIGILVSYILDPIVAALVARGIPRAMAATVVVWGLIVLLGFSAYRARGQVSAVVANLPNAAQELRTALEQYVGAQPGPLAQVQRAADELEQISKPASPKAPTPTIQKVQIQPQSFEVADFLWARSPTAASVVADAIVIVFLAFYLLLAGDLFRRHLIEIAGPTLTQKKITLQILNDISAQISVYLFVRTAISVIVAVATGLALWAVGLAQPAVWGFMAGVLNVAPYVGPFVSAVAIGLAAFLQFHTVSVAAVAVGVTVVVACVEAYLLTPWLTSRAADLNPVAVFIGLAFWAWVWGAPGLLLAVPMLLVMKAVGEHVEGLRPIAALLRA